MLQLMEAHDLLRCGHSWLARTHQNKNVVARTELLVAFLCCCGWIREAVHLVRYGRKNRFIEKSMLVNDKDLCDLWDELKRESSNRLKTIKRVRNEAIFHLDVKSAMKALTRIRGDVKGYPFVETAGAGKFGDTRYPWAYVAISAGFWKESESDDEIASNIGEVADFLPLFRKVLQCLLKGVWKNMGIELETTATLEQL